MTQETELGECLPADEVPEGMTRFMVTFRDAAAPDTFVVAHSRDTAKTLARDEQKALVHAARDPDSSIVEWDPDGVPADQWLWADERPAVVIDDFVHDPTNTSESLQVLFDELDDAMDGVCPECGQGIGGLRASLDMVFHQGEVTVRHVAGNCTVPITVNWTSEKGVYADREE